MPNERHSERHLEDELFERVRSTVAACYSAAAEHAQVLAEFGDRLEHPDGTYAIQRAARNEHGAIQGYNLALKALNDFLKHQRFVDE